MRAHGVDFKRKLEVMPSGLCKTAGLPEMGKF
jgi:hypothetical protein